MAPFRPQNLNKRLVSETGGNGGVIGPTVVPYLCGALSLGSRCSGGCCTGRFTLSESYCGVKCLCNNALVDCKGFFICCGPSTTKWFAAPSSTEVSRNWFNRGDAVTVANSCMGSCGWFVPECNQLQNPGYTCSVHWDDTGGWYWSNSEGGGLGIMVLLSNGFTLANGKNHTNSVRAFRCTST